MSTLKDVCLQEVFRIYSHGSISYADFLVLFEFCQGRQVVVELGTCTGSTTWLLSFIAKKIYTYDIFEDLNLIDNEKQRCFYKENWEQTEHYFHKVFTFLHQRENICIFKSKSTDKHAIEIHNDKSIDTIFIDADHSYDGVKKDFIAWFDKVKISGIFLFHDMVQESKHNL
ncbi:unnamed protein product, partial [marine sediment metagenome]